ncbi:hypothetical protein NL393_39180, partial [Klebsiella pneumoniae]|nr:hypothetical protein [Klebsiella pneumoniae]
RRHDIERPLLPPAELWLPPDTLRECLNRGERVDVADDSHAQVAQAVALGDQPAPDLPVSTREVDSAAALKSFLGSYPGR